jgi:type I restriction enzyme S subunit
MELRPGYKQTEVGVIPEDWEVKRLGELAELKNGYAFKSETYSGRGQYKVVTIANVQDGLMDMTKYSRIALLPRDLQTHHRLLQGDLLISMTGNVGRVCRVNEEDCVLNQRVGKFVALDVDPTLLLYLLAQQDFIASMAAKAKGGAQGNLSVSDIMEHKFAVPKSGEEQSAIATVLSDMDTLISTLDQLIAKKRDIKQAAMQQLLTGKHRLPGFSGEWEVVRLGSIANVDMGQSPYSENYNQIGLGVPLIQGNADLRNRKSIRRVWTTQITKTCDEGDLILTVRAPVGSIGIASEYSCLGRGVCSLKPISVHGPFLFHAMVFSESRWQALEQGSTFTSVNSNQIAEFPLLIAPTLDEQAAIATILSDMDAEVAALEQRCDKTRLLKQGMMQELLTGRVRLV